MHSERVSWIDVARGIGIILVVYAHALNGDSIRYLFYSFHMPLFFFLSGLVFHLKKHESLLSQTKKAIKGILFPYFLFSFLFLGIWVLTNNPSSFTLEEIVTQLYGILLGNGNNNYLAFNVVLWFLPCLFLTRILYTFLHHFIKNEKLLIAILGLFSVIGYAFSYYYPQLKLPLGAETALTAIVFFGSGSLVHEHAKKLSSLLRKHLILIFGISSIICITLATIQYHLSGHQIDLRLNRLDNYFLFYGAAVSGILSCLVLSITIRKNSLLEYIGRLSLVLLVWHLLVFTYLSKFLLLFISIEILNLFRNTLFPFIYTICAIAIILSINKGYQKVLLTLKTKKIDALK